MEYPVLEKGKQQAMLTVTEDGLYTIFEARLPPRQGLYRLWLVGDDGNFCLGLLEPGRGGRYFSRRFSRESLRRMPKQIKYALATGSKAVFTLRRPETASPVQPVQTAAQNSTLNWRAGSMGCYTAGDSLSRLVAIPTSIQGNDDRLRMVYIKGCRYMVFRY